MTALLVIMGSGETTPTMVEVHKRILARVGTDARLVDTPYGFQENADDLTQRALEYFSHNVGHEVEPVELRDVGALSPAELEDRVTACAEADWLFAGPGSPTYALRQWTATRFPEAVRARLHRPGAATVFASAAACSVGARTVPVYEIYKVGAEPFWATGLDLVGELGLDCVVIPHFDNNEGGGHDTRYCYLGEQRLSMMEEQLDEDTWVLGVDEHTALVVEVDTGRCRIEGRGGVTVRARGRHTVFGAGEEPTLDALRAAARGEVSAARDTDTVADMSSDASWTGGADRGSATEELADSPLLAAVEGHEEDFTVALDEGDAVGAADAILALEEELRAWEADSLQSDEMDRGRDVHRRLVVSLARAAQSGLGDPREPVRPLVELLLDLRSDARQAGDYATADVIRDAMDDAGIEVRDTPDGVEWDLLA